MHRSKGQTQVVFSVKVIWAKGDCIWKAWTVLNYQDQKRLMLELFFFFFIGCTQRSHTTADWKQVGATRTLCWRVYFKAVLFSSTVMTTRSTKRRWGVPTEGWFCDKQSEGLVVLSLAELTSPTLMTSIKKIKKTRSYLETPRVSFYLGRCVDC